MPTYLGYLHARFEAAGGRLETGTVGSLPAAAAEHGARAVLNCTGTGARDLLPDPALKPFRGQVVIANPGITEFFIGPADAETDLVYLFPHGDTVVLGGTEEWAATETGTPSRSAQAVAMPDLRDCAAIGPRVNGAPQCARPPRRAAPVPGRRSGWRAEPPGPGRSWCTTTATAAPGSTPVLGLRQGGRRAGRPGHQSAKPQGQGRAIRQGAPAR